MWDIPFDPSMLREDVIVHCPDKELVYELMRIFDEHRIHWKNDCTCSSAANLWNNKAENTCYRIHNGQMNYDSKYFYEEQRFQSYIKCTFYGEQPDFDVASDDELVTFLGIGR